MKYDILGLFKAYLNANLPQVQSFHPFFNEALAKMLKAGGKHFRAQLLLSVVNAKQPALVERALKIALAIELIHTYSLIHDDLPAMDNADFRRGELTLHKAYDETTAILVGDALNTEAFLLLSEAEFEDELKIKLVKSLAFNAGLKGMVIGQAMDCFFEDKKLDLQELEFLHTHKTAKLIAASLQMGALICKLDTKECEELYTLGLDIGLLFQINDDILDATSTKELAGKPTNHDTHKNSFVNLLSLEGALKAKDELSTKCFTSFQTLDKNLALSLKTLVQTYL
ncbi:geranyl transferase [Campylobacter sp. MIT 97-5078]|nr:geranyl transferase [Campylobacter sp. MIT 97-5078]